MTATPSTGLGMRGVAVRAFSPQDPARCAHAYRLRYVTRWMGAQGRSPKQRLASRALAGAQRASVRAFDTLQAVRRATEEFVERYNALAPDGCRAWA